MLLAADGRMPSPSAHSIDRILEAVRSVATQVGVERLSFRRIAQEAGMSPGTLTYYFDSKDSLLEAALDPYHRRVGRMLRRIQDPSARPEWNAVGMALVRHAFANRIDIRLQLGTWAHRWSRPRSRRLLVAKTLAYAARRPWPNQWNESDRRIVIQLVAFAVQHFAALADEDLNAITDTSDADEARERIMHVIDRVMAMLVMSEVPAGSRPAGSKAPARGSAAPTPRL